MSYGRITTETMTDIADAIRAKTGSEAQVTPIQMPEKIRSIQTGNPNAVLYVEQELTEEEKAQARDNIGAASEDDIPIVPTDISAFNNDSGYQTAPFEITITQDGDDSWTTTASAADIVAHVDNCIINFFGAYFEPTVVNKYGPSVNIGFMQSMIQYGVLISQSISIDADKNNNSVNVSVEFPSADLLPTVAASDNGKFLRVVGGAWAAQTVPIHEPRVAMTASDTAPTLDPNKLYVFPEMAILAPTFATPTDNAIVNEYHFMFTSGATATTLTIPATINQPDGFTVEANHVYEVSILENCMTAQGWVVTA